MGLIKKYIVFIFVLIIGLILRVYKLNTFGLFDYDSVKNFQIISEIGNSEFLNLFHHSSPTFYVLLLPFYVVSDNFILLEYFCALTNLLGVFLVIHSFSKVWKLDFWSETILFLLVASSTFLVISSRYLAIESLTILFFYWSFFIYLNSYKSNRHWFMFCVLIAITFTINYKTILFFLFLVIVEVLFRNDKRLLKRLSVFLIVISGVVILYSILGSLLGLPFTTYIKHLFVQIFARNPNPEQSIPLFNSDFLFYFKYIFQFENTMVLVGIATFIFKEIKRKTSLKKLEEKSFIILFIVFFLVIMSLLAKAPRGLLFIYPLLFALGYWQFFEVIKHRMLKVLFAIVCLSWNVWQINQHIYQYSSTNYQQITEVLKEKNITNIKTSVGLGISVFTEGEVKVESIFHSDSLKDYQGYFLRDDYWKVAKIGSFDRIEGRTVKRWNEPSLCSPFLYLESCEYNGNSYEQALKDWRSAKNQEYHLELMELK